MVGLAVVRDLREARARVGPEEIERFEADVVAGFVLARASAGLSDSTIRGDVSHLEQVRSWFGRPLWDMQPADADGLLFRHGAARGALGYQAGAGPVDEDLLRVRAAADTRSSCTT